MDKSIRWQQPSPLQLWGGPECTINRVADHYKDQLELTGHYNRASDIAAFAGLGIQCIRYPLLWERHEPEQGKVIDWTWASQQMDRIKRYGLEPIVGLVHHGSGPRYTNLLQESFATGLAAYGRQVAERFPWVNYYTPLNEPLTTARFSGLYGLWYPHRQDARSFVLMLLHQLKATVLTMQAIRTVNPEARLVQTEDLGKTHSTPLLRYQADFENERRWLTYDLLCGRVHRQHALYNYLIQLGIPEKQLAFFTENPCPPDILGLNHYITSERYLDEHILDFPVHTHGGNARHIYADTEAVRTGHRVGLAALLTEVWERYHLPMAITEAHIGCTWDEQIRWFKEVWDDACKVRALGADLIAVTAWSLLGSYDWHNLLTQTEGVYEPGVFDSRSGVPEKTPLAHFISQLTGNRYCYEDILKESGWWNHDQQRFPSFRKEKTVHLSF